MRFTHTIALAIVCLSILLVAICGSGVLSPEFTMVEVSNLPTELRQQTCTTTTQVTVSSTTKVKAPPTTAKVQTTTLKTTAASRQTTTAATRQTTQFTTKAATTERKSQNHTTTKVSSTTTTQSASSRAVNTTQSAGANDAEYLAIAIYREAGGDAYSDRTRIMVGNVVMNRVRSDAFPNTIYGVLTQRGQYQGLSNGVTWPSMASNRWEQHAVARARACANRVLAGENYLPANVVYQSDYSYLGSGVYCVADGMYFNYA